MPAKSQERLLPNSAFARNFNNYSLDDVKSAASVHEMSAPPSPERDALRNMEIENEGPRGVQDLQTSLVWSATIGSAEPRSQLERMCSLSSTAELCAINRLTRATVVSLCRYLLDVGALFQCQRQCHQLAEYRISLRFCSRQPVS